MEAITQKIKFPQLIKNIASNLFILVINILIGFWYTPFLVNSLGVEIYGLVPLAATVSNVLGILPFAFNTSAKRNFTLAVQGEDETWANQIFNAAMRGSLILVACVSPIAMVFIIFSPNIFQLSQELSVPFQLLLGSSIIAFFISTIRLNFFLVVYAKDRFDLGNVIALLSNLFQIGLIIVLFRVKESNLVYVSLAILSAALIGLIGDLRLSRWLLPFIKINPRENYRPDLQRLLGDSRWLFVYQSGLILFSNTEMLVASRTLNLKLAGMFGALLVLPKHARILANAIAGVWGPTTLSQYSKDDLQGLETVTSFSVKAIGLALALPLGVLTGAARPFLRLWLGEEFSRMGIVLSILVFHLAFNLISATFFNLQLALNRLRTPALMILSLGIANLFLSYISSKIFGPLGIAVSGAVTFSTAFLFLMPIYSAKALKLPWWHFIKKSSQSSQLNWWSPWQPTWFSNCSRLRVG